MLVSSSPKLAGRLMSQSDDQLVSTTPPKGKFVALTSGQEFAPLLCREDHDVWCFNQFPHWGVTMNVNFMKTQSQPLSIMKNEDTEERWGILLRRSFWKLKAGESHLHTENEVLTRSVASIALRTCTGCRQQGFMTKNLGGLYLLIKDLQPGIEPMISHSARWFFHQTTGSYILRRTFGNPELWASRRSLEM